MVALDYPVLIRRNVPKHFFAGESLSSGTGNIGRWQQNSFLFVYIEFIRILLFYLWIKTIRQELKISGQK